MKKEIKFEFQGKNYNIQVERSGNVLSIDNEGKSFQVSLAEEVRAAAPRPAAPAARQAAPAPAAAPTAAAPSAGGAASEKAAITGTIKEIKVAQGAAVNSGDLLIIMEAMKMDIEVFATKAGTVSAIHITPGVNVTEGQPLLDIS